ncbi:MAG: iron-containing alcohol dehydrogenase family protein, partial [Vagococcus sp.]|uniref:iron-containing alcohol dehydrogenase family protein n=1 Tax=Vagococcus sp. TaxID=1933889 RepID=UPI002FCBE9DD
RGAPQEYICKIGAWQELENHLIERRVSNVLVLHGTRSWEVAKTFFPKMNQIKCHYFHYKNECSFENEEFFIELVREYQFDSIIAIGGGKVLDLGKLVANDCLIDCICLPTLASTCAAYTPVSVIYNQKGEMVDMKFFARGISLTLVDPRIILNSPVDYFVAGIGDTLAKWYESDAVISQLENYPVELTIAKYSASECRKNLLEHGKKAIEDLKSGYLSESFVKVVETNILLAGMVGGFGDRYGRTSGAHSIHDALTYLPNTHKYLHGKKVAYGILVQLAIEEKREEIETLVHYYDEIDLPYTLAHLDIEIGDVDLIAEISNKDELMHLLPQKISKEVIKLAILSLEA